MGDSPLHLACVNHHTQAVNELLMNNADPHMTNCRGYTSLHYVAPFVGSTDIITRLILEGCDVNKPARNGQTALHIASLAGRLDHCEILVRNGWSSLFTIVVIVLVFSSLQEFCQTSECSHSLKTFRQKYLKVF